MEGNRGNYLLLSQTRLQLSVKEKSVTSKTSKTKRSRRSVKSLRRRKQFNRNRKSSRKSSLNLNLNLKRRRRKYKRHRLVELRGIVLRRTRRSTRDHLRPSMENTLKTRLPNKTTLRRLPFPPPRNRKPNHQRKHLRRNVASARVSLCLERRNDLARLPKLRHLSRKWSRQTHLLKLVESRNRRSGSRRLLRRVR
jgi:hypothetical protein